MTVKAVNFALDPCYNETPRAHKNDRPEADQFMMEANWREARTEYAIIKAMHEGASTLDEISERSGVARMTCYRALKRFKRCNLVRQERGAQADGKKKQEPDRWRWVG